MRQTNFPGKSLNVLAAALLLGGLYVTSRYSYVLFHSLAEAFSIVIACGAFMIAWNSRRFTENGYLLFFGIASLFLAAIDLVHTLAYKGMGVFQGYDANLPTQLWIFARYLQALSLLTAPLFLRRKFNPYLAIAGYAVIVSLGLGAIFSRIFPICYVEGSGLTPFKIYSEYVISLILLASILLLLRRRESFDRAVLRLLVWAILLTIASELAFTQYISVYGFSNLLGHYFKILAFFLIYKAIIETGLTRPFDLLFRDLKQREEAIQKLNEDLQRHARQLEDANRELEAFSYSVSHDLRAPVRSIGGFIQALDEDYGNSLAEQGKDYLRRIRANAERMERLIEDLLKLSRLTLAEMHFETVDLSALGSEIAAELQTSEPGRKAEFLIAPKLTANGDPSLLRALLTNLLGNAWKFTGKREVARIEFGVVEGGELRVTGGVNDAPNARHSSLVTYYVKDNGAGFDPAQSGNLFAPFQRLHSQAEFSGTGIGLATVQRIVHRHGGRIWAEGKVGEGAVFYFTLESL